MKERLIYLRAAEIQDHVERQRYLDAACGNDPNLRSRIQTLLDVSKNLGNFLDPGDTSESWGGIEPPAHDADAPDSVGATQDWRRPQIDPADSEAAGDIDLGFLAPASQPGCLGVLGHYAITEVIGQGAFGVVLGGRDTKLERDVAVKVLLPHLARTSPPRKRFLREARAGAAIRHPNVVQVYAVEEQPIPYIVMERVRGRTLQDAIDSDGPLEMQQVFPIAAQLSQALAAAHATGLVHRDVKPTNILVEPGREERVVLTDFGLARTMDDASLTQSGFVAGTPMYMSPEQTHGQSIDPRSDQFSLGSVLYLMVTGRPPFRASSALGVMRRVAEARPRPIQEINPDVPSGMIQVIETMMQRDPNDRYASMDQAVHAIQALKSSWTARASAPLFMPMSPKKPAHVGAILKMVGALVLLLACGIGISLRFSKTGELSGQGPSQTYNPSPSSGPAASIDSSPSNESDPSKRSPSTSPLESLPDHPDRNTQLAQQREPSPPSERVIGANPDPEDVLRQQARQEFSTMWPSDAPAPAEIPCSSIAASELQQKWADYMRVPVEYTDPMGIRFRLIPPGIFKMGSPVQEQERALAVAVDTPFWCECIRNEGPQHWVVVSRPYYVSMTEITQSQYENVMSWNPSRFQPGGERSDWAENHDTRLFPAEGMTWTDAVDFCIRLNRRYNLPCGDANTPRTSGAEGWPGGYGLLTEAQWEFACRAGTTTAYWTGDSEASVSLAENMAQSIQGPVPVGPFLPNGFGLFDMHGNIGEYVYDPYEHMYFEGLQPSVALDPYGPTKVSSVSMRMVRGGDYFYPADVSRSASRWACNPTERNPFQVGVRLCLTVQAVKRLVNFREPAPLGDVRVVHGADLTRFQSWVESLGTKHIPSCINTRSGSTELLLDAVAVTNPTNSEWMIRYSEVEEDAHEQFHELHGVYGNYLRMHLQAPKAKREGIPLGLLLWKKTDDVWQTWFQGGPSDLEDIQQGSRDGWLPTSIDVLHFEEGSPIAHTRLSRPAIGNHCYVALSLRELESKLESYRERQWRPELLQTPAASSSFQCAVVFRENTAGLEWDASLRILESELDAEIAQRLQAKKQVPYAMASYVDGTEVRYVVFWLTTR